MLGEQGTGSGAGCSGQAQATVTNADGTPAKAEPVYRMVDGELEKLAYGHGQEFLKELNQLFVRYGLVDIGPNTPGAAVNFVLRLPQGNLHYENLHMENGHVVATAPGGKKITGREWWRKLKW